MESCPGRRIEMVFGNTKILPSLPSCHPWSWSSIIVNHASRTIHVNTCQYMKHQFFHPHNLNIFETSCTKIKRKTSNKSPSRKPTFIAMAPLGAGALPLLEALGREPQKTEIKWLLKRGTSQWNYDDFLLGLIIQTVVQLKIKHWNSVEKEHHWPNPSRVFLRS